MRPTQKAKRTDKFSNKFCRADDLSNEASVEQFFVSRLLEDLGYKDDEIKPKKAISELPVGKGRRKESYKPDFLIYGKKKPRWVIDAKAVDENPDKYVDQGAGYCLAVNQKYADTNPCHYFVLSNGFLTRVYRWDKEQPILSLRFADFADGNTKYAALTSLLGADAVRRGWAERTKITSAVHKIARPTMEEVKKTFARCHRIIWKAEKVSPQAAFLRFAKILFVKLWEDRKIRDNPEHLAAIGRGDPLPADAVRFSARWIDQQAADEENPVDRILFRQLVESIETEIQARKRKRIFGSDARLDVSPGTVKRVVAALEHQYLFGIDEDLNGRMFEAFLVATMRGQELGQYFTPRSIVKLMTRLGGPVAIPTKIERVLDGCCGTGGFLIEVLTEMRRQVYENTSLTKSKRAELLNEVANEAIFGIDAGQDPPLVKITRINMYLHGDGGSRVYMADGLRKTPAPSGTDDAEGKQEVAELKKVLGGDTKTGPLRFDLVLTNPPFSMDYRKDAPEEWEVLKDYDLRTWDGKNRPSLRSAIMFMERYADILSEHGRLVTVIDDAILNSYKNSFAREFIRSRFIIRAVISLPSDAFARVGARVKTSILYLVRRAEGETGQPDAFMYECQYVGLDDVPMKTRPSKALLARQNGEQESEEVLKAFRLFAAGKKGAWLVSSNLLSDRLDVKSCLPRTNDVATTWSADGLEVVPLSSIVDPVTNGAFDPATASEKSYALLRVRYDGIAEEGEVAQGNELTNHEVWQAKANDLVSSNIALALGSICVMPPDLVHCIASTEFTIMRVKDPRFNEWFLWGFLRSSEVRARLLSQSTGLARHRVGWEVLRDIPVPVVDADTQKRLGEMFKESVVVVRTAEKTRAATTRELSGLLNLDNEWAVHRLRAAKPPK